MHCMIKMNPTLDERIVGRYVMIMIYMSLLKLLIIINIKETAKVCLLSVWVPSYMNTQCEEEKKKVNN